MNKAIKFAFTAEQKRIRWNFNLKTVSGKFRSGLFILPILHALLILALTSCGQNTIVKRWTAAGEIRKGKMQIQDNHNREYEFLKSGKFNIYKNGDIEGSGTYTMATDGKSVLVKDGNQSATLKIHKLTTSELIMVFPGKDTIVYYPSGSTASKQTQAKVISYYELQKRWLNLVTDYQRRSDLIENLIQMGKHSTDANNEIFARLSSTRKETNEFDTDLDKLSKEKLSQYENLQTKFSKEIVELLLFLKKYPGITERVNEYTLMLPKLETNIEKARAEFVPSFHAYKTK